MSLRSGKNVAITGHEQHGGLYSQEASRGRRRRRGLGPTTTEAPRVRGGRRTTTEAPRVRGGRRGGTTRGIPCDTKVKVVLLFCCALWFCAFVLLVQAQCLGRPWGGGPPAVSKKSRGWLAFAVFAVLLRCCAFAAFVALLSCSAFVTLLRCSAFVTLLR